MGLRVLRVPLPLAALLATFAISIYPSGEPGAPRPTAGQVPESRSVMWCARGSVGGLSAYSYAVFYLLCDNFLSGPWTPIASHRLSDLREAKSAVMCLVNQ